jgi:hypothetical protein
MGDTSNWGPTLPTFEANVVQRGSLCFSKAMQRLYCTFPSEWPGCGLLMLRIAQCSLVFTQIAARADGSSSLAARLVTGFELCTTALLATGLLTPVAGVVQALLEGAGCYLLEQSESACLMTAALSMGLAMLGPGAWSFDAWRFGRYRIDLL